MILGKFFKDRRLWLITIAVFILVITVFDKNNLIEAWRLKQKINELEAQKDYYQNRSPRTARFWRTSRTTGFWSSTHGNTI